MYAQQDLFPSRSHNHTIGKLCRVFIAWRNFDIGLEICFYRGMDGYQQLWLTYGYALYLVAIQVMIILMSRRYILFTRLVRRNVVSVLATLLYLMFSPLTYAGIQTLQSTDLHVSTPNGTLQKSVWQFDGNILYLRSKHIPLFTVALICSITMCWFTFSLFLIQCLQRRAHFICFRWVEKLRPFFEAFTGPCRDGYRFWPGFLLFMRSSLYILNTVTFFSNTPLKKELTKMGTAAACILIMSLACAFPHSVYKKWSLNMLEFSFFLNLCITSALLVIFQDHYSGRIVYTSVSITILTFLGILTYHVSLKIKFNVWCTRLKLWLSRIGLFQLGTQSPQENSDETTSFLSQPLPHVIQYGQYREPLIDDTDN